MELKIKLSLNGTMPKKAHESDSGFDCYVSEIKKVSLFKVHYKLGFSVDFEPNMYAEVFSRSSVHKRYLWLCNSTGIIDNGYKGEWHGVFYKIPFVSRIYKVGERCCQFLIKFNQDSGISLKQVSSTSSSERGDGGFGSSGN